MKVISDSYDKLKKLKCKKVDGKSIRATTTTTKTTTTKEITINRTKQQQQQPQRLKKQQQRQQQNDNFTTEMQLDNCNARGFTSGDAANQQADVSKSLNPVIRLCTTPHYPSLPSPHSKILSPPSRLL